MKTLGSPLPEPDLKYDDKYLFYYFRYLRPFYDLVVKKVIVSVESIVLQNQ
jgi:hypothetical protein